MARKNYNKQQLRDMYKDSIVHTDRPTKISELKRIMNLLTYREEYTDAKVIAFYWPKDTELDTIPMIDFALYQGKKVVLPHITSDTNMEFKEIESVEYDREVYKGITQPTKEHITVAKDDIDLFVIPVLAFNKDGHRVGSGKGYYDRYFEGLDDLVSIILSQASREHNFKAETHDIPSKIIITEQKLIRIHESGYHLNDKDELIIPTLELHIDPKMLEEESEVNDFLDDTLEVNKDKPKEDNESKDEEKSKENDKPTDEEKSKDEDLESTGNITDLLGDDAPKDEAKKKAHIEEKSLNQTITAMGMTAKEANKKRKEEAKEAKIKLKEQKLEAKRIAKEAEADNVEDDLRKKLADDDKKKKANDLSDIPDADKLLAILESNDEKPKKEKKAKPKKEKKEKKVKPKKEKKAKK